MGSDNKTKIFIMAGVLAAAVVIFVLFVMKGNKGSESPTPPGPPVATTPGGPAAPGAPGTPMPSTTPGAPMPATTPGAPMTGAPATAGMMTMPGAPAPPALTPPDPPPVLTAPTVSMGGLPDPFGGKADWIPPQPPPPMPRVVLVSSAPPAWVTDRSIPVVKIDDIKRPTGGTPIGRLAGWIFNSNGQLVAIFEDSDGISRTVRIGDTIEDKIVKELTPDAMILEDTKGDRTVIKLQGLDNYQGKSRSVNVNVISPTAPPAWGAR